MSSPRTIPRPPRSPSPETSPGADIQKILRRNTSQEDLLDKRDKKHLSSSPTFGTEEGYIRIRNTSPNSSPPDLKTLHKLAEKIDKNNSRNTSFITNSFHRDSTESLGNNDTRITIPDDINPSDTTPLLGDNPESSTCHFFDIFHKAATYTCEHPSLTALSAASALPSVINAVAMPSGLSPANIGLKWWHDMSPLVKTWSLLNGSSSLLVNLLLNMYFFPKSWETFKTKITHTFDSPKDFAENIIAIILGGGGAIALAAITYNAYLFLPLGEMLALIPSALGLLVSLAQRYSSTSTTIDLLKRAVNGDAKAQSDFVDQLRHINNSDLDKVQEAFEIIAKVVSERAKCENLSAEVEYNLLVGMFAEKLEAMSDCGEITIKDKTTRDCFLQYAGTFVLLLFAFSVIGLPAMMMFMQKGFDGINTLYKLSHHGETLNSLNEWYKRLIGFTPSISSSFLYALSAYNLASIIPKMVRHLREHPKDIPLASGMVIANGLAGSSPYSVADGIVKNPNNIEGLTPGNLSTTLIWAYAAGGSGVNLHGSLGMAFQNNSLPVKDLTVEKIISLVESNPVKSETAKYLKKHSIWQKDKQTNRNIQEPVGGYNSLAYQNV